MPAHITKLNKKQRANNIAITMLAILNNQANDFRKVLEKGIGSDGKPLDVTPAMIKACLDARQLDAITAFIANFASAEEKPGSKKK